jgi:hypothetical protein
LDLQTAARRYEEMRRFWAREMAIKLVEGHCRRLLSLLRSMQASTVPMSTRMLAATWPSGDATAISHERSTVTALTALRRAGMVKRSPRADCIYWYALTELGELVCMYLPVHSEIVDPSESPVHSEIVDPSESPVHSEASFDRDKHRLGKLCHRGHDFTGTGRSLRHKQNGSCIVCQKEDRLAWQQRKRGRPHKTLVAATSE